MSRRTIAVIAAAVLVAAGVCLWLLPRKPATVPPARPPVVVLPKAEPWHRPASMPATQPDIKKWLSRGAYLDGQNHIVGVYDTDGDGLFDADEMLLYGTLRYDAHSRANAREIRMQALPRPTTLPHRPITQAEVIAFREMAKRPLRPEEDTDHDGLPDAWEMAYFGSLQYDKWDDPDGDGFPNVIKYRP